MFDLFVTSDIARRLIEDSLAVDNHGATREAQKPMPRRRNLRAASAAALRGLAERLEPSPSA
jgi:hypothetical protein